MECAMNEWSNNKLCDIANLILGLFLLLSPWIVGYSGSPVQYALISGLVIAGLSAPTRGSNEAAHVHHPYRWCGWCLVKPSAEVDPVSWTPEDLCRRSPRCRAREGSEHHTRLSFGGRWLISCVLVARPRS